LKARILVIEDNQINFELIADLLEAEEFAVFQARTAEEGLRLARDGSPDLILMDIGLPGMDGLAAAKRLKTDPLTRHMPVVALTAHAMRGDEKAALAAGCVGYLTKPIDTRTFSAKVVAFIAAQQNQFMQSEILSEKPLKATARANRRVLIVDDEEPNRVLLRDPLEALGYDVTEAENGPQAIESIAGRPPDAILLDVMMPGMDGFALCRCLKQEARTAHIPVLMITALSERRERLMGIEAGANDFLTKPVDVPDLTLRVANALYLKSLFDQLQNEREKSDRLLLNTLPNSIAQRMKNGEVNIADHHVEVTVLVANLVGFTALAAHVEPDQIVCMLNEIFSAFDLLTEKHRVEKIRTSGDTYLAAGGLPSPLPDHAKSVAQLALEMRHSIEQFNSRYGTSVLIRIGIHSGPVVAGVIGKKKFTYDLWGETVNIASRLETICSAGEILISESTYQHLKNGFCFGASKMGDLNGCGSVRIYALSALCSTSAKAGL
jgi:adenylate cyclase